MIANTTPATFHGSMHQAALRKLNRTRGRFELRPLAPHERDDKTSAEILEEEETIWAQPPRRTPQTLWRTA